MDEHEHHEQLIADISEEFKEIFEKSPQGIYIYLDDAHKTCNKKFAKMLGYKSVKEWMDTDTPVEDVEKTSRDLVINAYFEAMSKGTGASFDMKFKSRKGKSGKAGIILVPISFQGHNFALHFITEKK